MIFLVRHVENRKIHDSYNQVDYKLLVDNKRDPINHFIDSLSVSNGEPFILMEDDLVLCRDFENEVNDAISKYPNDIINFFSNPDYWEPTHYHKRISWNQCTYYPKNVGIQLYKVMSQYPKNFDTTHGFYSVVETKALKELGMEIVEYRPHLVQHLDMDTNLFKFSSHTRRSRFFLDYLKELGISYEDAGKKYFLLGKQMQKHFKELEKWYYE